MPEILKADPDSMYLNRSNTPKMDMNKELDKTKKQGPNDNDQQIYVEQVISSFRKQQMKQE